MQGDAVLNTEDRNFFTLVTKSIYMNSFLDERKQILFQISPHWNPIRSITPELNERLGQLERKGLKKIQSSPDQLRVQLLSHIESAGFDVVNGRSYEKFRDQPYTEDDLITLCKGVSAVMGSNRERLTRRVSWNPRKVSIS